MRKLSVTILSIIVSVTTVILLTTNLSFIFNYTDSIRRIRNVSELITGRSYSPQELRQRGFRLTELTLNGIVSPESIPEDENYLIYQIWEDNKKIGWLWKNILLDKNLLQRRYELFVDAWARMDIILERGELPADTLRRVDDLRHRMHLWAKLLGMELKFPEGLLALHEVGELLSRVEVDLINRRMQRSGWNNFFEAEGANFGLFRELDEKVELAYNYMMTKEETTVAGSITIYEDVRTLYIYKAIAEYWINLAEEIEGEEGIDIKKAILFTERPIHVYTHIHEDSRDHEYNYRGTATLNFHRGLMDWIKSQFEYLKPLLEGLSPSDELKEEIKHNLITALKNEFTSERLEEYLRENGLVLRELSKVNGYGIKGSNLMYLQSMGLPVPNFYIVKPGEEPLLNPFIGNSTLLVSVRSNPYSYIPGILDTILNIGATEERIENIAAEFGERFAYETYMHFLRSFGIYVFGLDEGLFGEFPSDLDAQRARELAQEYKSIIENQGFIIPQDPYLQLEMAVNTVMASWGSPQAIRFRQRHGIPEDVGMGVIIQEMKFGNMNEISGSFILSTRDPVTGEKKLVINYAPQTQGEELMSGSAQLIPIEEAGLPPGIIDEIESAASRIEAEFKDMQRIEGVIENGKLWILESHEAPRGPEAEARIAVEMVNEGLITKEEVFKKIKIEQLKEQLEHLYIDPRIRVLPVAEGEPVYSGAVSGAIALSLSKIIELKMRSKDTPIIWIKKEGYPQDYEGIVHSAGLVMQDERRLNHAAILAMGEKKPTIVGVNLTIDERSRTVTIGSQTFKEGDFITIDGLSGKIYAGQLPLVKPQEINPYFRILAQWYREIFGEDI